MWAVCVKTKDGEMRTAKARSFRYALERLAKLFPQEMDEVVIDTVVIGNRPTLNIVQGRGKDEMWT